MVRQRQNFLSGTLSAQLLTAGTTMSSVRLADLDTVLTPDIAIIVLDPLAINGDPEIVHVTAHTSGVNTATVLRGQENTVARDHASGTTWKHAPTEDDYESPPAASGTVVTETAFGQASSPGAAATFSKGDHTHGTPAAPSVPSASGSVVSETAFGQAASAGAAATFSRGDHTHGTPADPGEPELFARKTASESVTSSTVLQNDDHLFVSVLANTTYEILLLLRVSGNSALNTGDLRIDLTIPAGAALLAAGVGVSVSSTDTKNEQLAHIGDMGSGSSRVFGTTGTGGGAANSSVLVRGILVVAGTAGTLQLQWAQNVSSATPTTLHTNSFMVLRELA